MDYARFNYVAQPGDGVTALSPHIGPYDMFAIEYGYRWYGKETPEAEKELLAGFLDRHTDRLYNIVKRRMSGMRLTPVRRLKTWEMTPSALLCWASRT